jgi:3-hydroxyacyl-CoA dehydrogenase / enoyl-CoA hydratase / 3-hydroxybutyryl-CoA epimerase
MQESIRIVGQGEIAVVEFDLIGEKVNKWNSGTLARFREILNELKASPFKAVIFKSNKSKIYIAGADIEEIKKINSKDGFAQAIDAGQGIFNLVEDLPMPTIAAIHGACLGGGCEFVMACDYRIATDANETKIGLPETKLGIIPGFGGCVRMPRMLGLQNAFDIILQGKAVNGKKAQKIGLVDRVVHPAILMEQAFGYAREVMQNGGKKRRKTFQPKGALANFLESFVGRQVVYRQARKSVLQLTHGHYPAPLVAIEVIAGTYKQGNREKALQVEKEGFCRLAVGEVSKNLLHVFDLTEMVKKQTGTTDAQVKARDVRHLGILGAGTMGGGIAYVAADKGIDVRMKDVNMEAVAKGIKHARDLWQKLVKRKAITEYDLRQKVSLVTGGVDYSGFAQCDVVIEAIVEDMEIKKKVIAETAKQMKAEGIIATNTSSLSVTEMAKGHPRPEYFAGMHFFNPVNKMPLVEVIRGESSSDQTIATVFELAKKMGKMPVVVKDGPGFLVNRLLLPYMGEAAFLLQEGMDIRIVDGAFVKEFGMPMGPFALMDEVGLDVCIKVLKIFKKSFGSRVEMAPCMERLEKTGRLGKKNGKGFYLYSKDGRRLEVDGTVYADLGLAAPGAPLAIKECLERGVFAMVNECSRALIEDRIVNTAAEVDLAMIMGTGFPPFRGGLLKYADSIGSQYICDQLEIYSTKQAARLKPATPLVNLAKNNSKFYKIS